MRIFDVQMHEPAPVADWGGDSNDAQQRLLVELTLSWLNAAGVDGVVLFPADEAWAAWAAATHPDRLGFVPIIRPDVPDIDAVVRAAKERHGRGHLGFRAVFSYPLDGSEVKRLDAGAWDPVFAACEKYQVPLFILVTRWLSRVAGIATRFPKLTLIVDHVGMPQPPNSAWDDPPFKALPALLALAQFPNIHVKLCGLPSLSRERFPYKDVAPHLRAIVDAYGADRLMWGSDTTRFFGVMGLKRHALPAANGPYPGKHTYAESLHFVRESDVLSDAEKEAILGGTLCRVLGWPREGQK